MENQQVQNAKGTEGGSGNGPLEFIEAKVVVSRDQKQIIHILDDGRAIGKPVGYYGSIVERLKKK